MNRRLHAAPRTNHRGLRLIQWSAAALLALLLSMLLVPTTYRLNELGKVEQAQNLVDRVSQALATHRLDHGGYPERLAALTPDYLESLPLDPWG